MRKLVLACCAAMALSFAQSALAHVVRYRALMDGPSESPPQITDGIGMARVTLDLDLGTMRVEASFSGLSGNSTDSHIHCCTGGVFSGTSTFATTPPSFPGFPRGVRSGVYDQTLDMTIADNYNPTFVTLSGGTVGQAYNAFVNGLAGGHAYFNIHSMFAQTGEIRGFLHPVPSGDYNFNGAVDTADYTLWRDSLGQVGPNLDADGDDDGQIDVDDYDIWRSKFGQTTGGSGSSGASLYQSAVPEPTCLALLCTGIFGLFVCHRPGRDGRTV